MTPQVRNLGLPKIHLLPHNILFYRLQTWVVVSVAIYVQLSKQTVRINNVV